MNQLRYVLLVITLVALVGVSALALNVPNTFVSGEVISAAEMNANFAAVAASVTALESQVAALQAAQPVVAHAKSNFEGFTGFTTDAKDLVVVDIVVPAAGVVVVEAATQTAYFGTTSENRAALRIDTMPGGAIPFTGPESYVFGADQPANIAVVYGFAALRRTFTVEAGTHTFRLKGFDLSDDGTKYVYNPSITATWYPASQATVPASSIALSPAGSGSTQDR